jgi:flagellar biosynthetic protein FliR
MTEQGFYTLGLFQVMKFLLVLARVGGIFTACPVFANVHVPPRVRVAMAVAMTIVFFPMVEGGIDRLEVLPFVFAVVREACIGLTIGFVVALVFSAIHVAGAYMDLVVGFGFANIVDPMVKETNAVVGQFYNLLATLIFLCINGHHIVIRGLAESFAVLPLAHNDIAGLAAQGIMTAFAAIFGSALRIALPVVGATFLTDVSLGILARTVPQLNVFVVGFPAKLAVAFFVLLGALPLASKAIGGLFVGVERDILLVLKHLAT